MPEVQVHAMAALEKDQKRALSKGISKAVVRHFGVTAGAVLVEVRRKLGRR